MSEKEKINQLTEENKIVVESLTDNNPTTTYIEVHLEKQNHAVVPGCTL